MSKLIFCDLDDTLADFTGHPVFGSVRPLDDVSHMYEKGFFLSLEPIEGALTAIRSLIHMGHDIHILSQPVADSALSYLEKVMWVAIWFPELSKKIHLTQDKGLFVGDYLIDDNAVKWKQKFETNGGTFIHFNYHADHKKQWQAIVKYFKEQK